MVFWIDLIYTISNTTMLTQQFMACKNALDCDTSPTKPMTNNLATNTTSHNILVFYMMIATFTTKCYQMYS